jgi:hypothetical protein
MKRFVKIAGIPIAGFFILIVGFMYDLFFAGIPYQDPTPELQARWEFHKSVADVFYTGGSILFLVGLIAMPVIWMKRDISAFVKLLLLFAITILVPFAWIMRDGLGPDSATSSGIQAIFRCFMTFYSGPTVIVLGVLATVFHFSSRRGKSHSPTNRNFP